MTRKLDKEHLEEIQSIREQFAQNANILGNIAIEIHFLEKRLEQVKQEHAKYIQDFERLQRAESELVDKMRARYGKGQINIAEGTFTESNGLVQ